MTENKPTRILIILLFFASSISIHCRVEAQDLHLRVARYRLRRAIDMSRQTALTGKTIAAPRWLMPAQVIPAMQQSLPESTPPAAPLPSPRTPEAQAGEPQQPRRELKIYVSSALGFDKESAINTGIGLLQVEDRRIFSLSLTAEYPIDDNTNISVLVPYIYQTGLLTFSAGPFTQSFSQKGRGIGDVALYLERIFPDIAKGSELSVVAGMQFPTGKDPFNLNNDELPTGIGFYRPLARVTLRKVRVPLQFYAAVDYATAFSRNIDGEKVTLPDSYGGELGFYYTLGPEFTAGTSLSLSKESSPFILGPSATVGYLSQSLTYNSGGRTTLQASVDVGLTEDSTDAYLGLTVLNSF